MYLLQALIVFAVVGSNIHYRWTDNNVAASVIGGLVAWGVTWVWFNRRDLRGAFLRDTPQRKDRSGNKGGK